MLGFLLRYGNQNIHFKLKFVKAIKSSRQFIIITSGLEQREGIFLHESWSSPLIMRIVFTHVSDKKIMFVTFREKHECNITIPLSSLTCLLNPCFSSMTKVWYKLQGVPVMVEYTTDSTMNIIDWVIWGERPRVSEMVS